MTEEQYIEAAKFCATHTHCGGCPVQSECSNFHIAAVGADMLRQKNGELANDRTVIQQNQEALKALASERDALKQEVMRLRRSQMPKQKMLIVPAGCNGEAAADAIERLRATGYRLKNVSILSTSHQAEIVFERTEADHE